MKRVVISLHGMNSRGEWQKSLAAVLAKHDFLPFMLDYGSFGTRTLGWRAFADRLTPGPFVHDKVNWLLDCYTRICNSEKVRRPSVIAHSFGTYIVARTLETYPQVTFNKVIFCGSVVTPDYDWPTLIDVRHQVNSIRNDMGGLDMWARIAKGFGKVLGPGFGDSGRTGFTRADPSVNRDFRKYGHSDFFHRLHFEDEWIPYLKEIRIAESDRDEILSALKQLVDHVAWSLRVEAENLRAAVFLPTEEDHMVIPEGLSYNVAAPETTLRIRVGYPVAGKTFEQRRSWVVMREDIPGLPGEEEIKVSPELEWFVSSPLPDPHATYGVVGVVNVDGLRTRVPKQQLEDILTDSGYQHLLANISDSLLRVL